MALLKSIVLLLSITMLSDAFSVRARAGSQKGAHRLLLLSSTTSPTVVFRPTSTTQTTHSFRLKMSKSDVENEPWYSQVSVPYASMLAVFIGFAAFLAPGEFGSELDNNMIQAYIDNPASPGLNPIFNTEFNLLGAAALVLAGLVVPQALPNKGLPPGPFLAASAFAGYGGLGPYMTFRKGPRENVTQADLGWVSKNIFENKVFNLAVLALCLYQYYTMAGPLMDDPATVWNDFLSLVTTSKFASVSSLDLAILSLTGASLIPLDYKYRRPDGVDSSRGTLIAASTLLLPLLGSAIYCAVRPSLPNE